MEVCQDLIVSIMKITINKQFNSREELDNFIRNTYGEDSIKNKDLTLEMENEDLKKFSLSEKTNIFGVKVKKV